MSSPVTTVLFDLDETLCEYPKPGTRRLSEAFERAEVSSFFTYDDYRRKIGSVGGTESDVRRREECFLELARERDVPEQHGLRVADAYEALTDYTAVELVPGAERVLQSLDSRYTLGLVTNGGPDTQSVKIDALGVRDWFDTIVLAGYETAPKPDPEPFERAITDLGVTTQETVYVGNSLRTDIEGANASGLRSVWTPDSDSLDASPGNGADRERATSSPTYRISSVRELENPPWEE